MKKKLIICVLIILTLFNGCGALNSGAIKKTNGKYRIEDYRDQETGVHYLIYINYYQGGMSVRYNSDGTIMVN